MPRVSKRAGQVHWRSGYEKGIREWLDAYGVPYQYEAKQFLITVPVPGSYCDGCMGRNILRDTTYTPDFYLPQTKIVMEAKGKFDARARKIALAMKGQHPGVDYRILLQRDNWMTGKKVRRYSDWLTKNNIPFAIGKHPPPEWCVPAGSSVQSFAVPYAAARYTPLKKQRRKS